MVRLRQLIAPLLILALVMILHGGSNLVHNPHFTGSWSGSNSGIDGGWSSLDSLSNVSSIRFLDIDVAYAAPDTSGDALLAITNAAGGGATSVVASVYPVYSNSGSPYLGGPMTTNMTSATPTNWGLAWTAQAGADAYYIMCSLDGAAGHTSVAPAATGIVLTNFGGAQIVAGRWRLTTNSVLVGPDTNGYLKTDGDGSDLSGVLKPADTNGHLTSATDAWWDVDTLTAQATTGSVVYSEGGSGNTYTQTSIDVYPIYSNSIGRVFGTPMSASEAGADRYHVWTWDAQPNAVGYLLHGVNDTTLDEYFKEVGSGTVTINFTDLGGGADINPKPSAIAKTNEIVSTWLVIGTEPGIVLGPSWTNALAPFSVTNLFVPWSRTNEFATPGQVAGATNNLASGGSVYPATNATIYVDPSFPGPFPYMTSLVQALDAVAGIGGERSISNRTTIRVSGRNRFVADGSHTYSTSNYNYLALIAEPDAVIWTDITPVADAQAFITISSSNVMVDGGKWISYNTSGDNERFLSLSGKFPNIFRSTWVSDGPNGNMNGALSLKNSAFAWVNGCQFFQGATAGSGCRPIDIEAAAYSTIQNSIIQMWRSGNIALNLNNATEIEFLNCSMVCSNTSTSQAFLRLHPANAVYEGCSFVNLGTTNIFGIAGDTDRTIWLIDCVFNTASWLGDPGLTTTGTWTVVPGYPGVRITTQD